MRYSRQEVLEQIRKKGQTRLLKAKIVIIGIGALGTVLSELLARAGIGSIILIDRDFIELSNLQRQSLFTEKDVGKPKAQVAFEKLRYINSGIKIKFLTEDLDFENIDSILKNSDLILDCTDNLETRFLLNDYCVKNKIPLIYSAGVGTKGYVFNVIPKKTACLRCFLDSAQSFETCETTGVLNSLTHQVASMQAVEAIKILLGKDFEKDILFIDAWNHDISKIKVNRKKDCKCCIKKSYEYLNGKVSSKTIKLCGSDIFQVKAKKLERKQFFEIKAKLINIGEMKDFGNCINFNDKITLFQDGRALIKAKDEKEARTLYSKFVGN